MFFPFAHTVHCQEMHNAPHSHMQCVQLCNRRLTIFFKLLFKITHEFEHIVAYYERNHVQTIQGSMRVDWMCVFRSNFIKSFRCEWVSFFSFSARLIFSYFLPNNQESRQIKRKWSEKTRIVQNVRWTKNVHPVSSNIVWMTNLLYDRLIAHK